VIGYVSGLALMPGANIQFQFWFTPLLPILIQMVGLPYWVTLPVYFFFFPVVGTNESGTEPVDPAKSHVFLLALCLWHLTIGPSDNLLERFGMKKVKKE